MPQPSPVSVRKIEAESDERQRALGASGAAVETNPRSARRAFSAADKLRIVRKANACVASGERGSLEAMLRKEGIYSSMLSTWRAQFGAQGTSGLEPRQVGRKPKLDAKDRRNADLVKRNVVLERKLHIAEAIIELQKKAHEILGIALPMTDGEG